MRIPTPFRTLLVLVLLGAPSLHAQTGGEASAEPLVEVGGVAFDSWEAYARSETFRALGLRCGTPLPADRPQQLALLRGSQADCSALRTSIRDEYSPFQGRVYQIPVVFHAIERDDGFGHVPDSYFLSQIEVLNEDFNALPGSNGAPGTNGRFYFYLATEDPQGQPTTGIDRVVNNTWFNDSGSYWNTLAWDPNRYLNIYSNTASGNLGYVPALPQNGIVGSASDRVVVLWSTIGRNGLAGPPYNLGRTVTHEVGHYLGLEHTFNGSCASVSNCYANGDLICDTNPEGSPTFGCPGSRTSCSLPAPFHNYMDYADDLCMNQFTREQVNRMRCTLENWRVDLHVPECKTSATASVRSATGNPDALTASVPSMGEFLSFGVSTGAFGMATIVVHGGPANLPLGGGQVVLVDLASPLIAQFGPFPGPLVDVRVPVPVDPALCGFPASTQAILFGGAASFALSNAVDLVVGG